VGQTLRMCRMLLGGKVLQAPCAAGRPQVDNWTAALRDQKAQSRGSAGSRFFGQGKKRALGLAPALRWQEQRGCLQKGIPRHG